MFRKACRQDEVTHQEDTGSSFRIVNTNRTLRTLQALDLSGPLVLEHPTLLTVMGIFTIVDSCRQRPSFGLKTLSVSLE